MCSNDDHGPVAMDGWTGDQSSLLTMMSDFDKNPECLPFKSFNDVMCWRATRSDVLLNTASRRLHSDGKHGFYKLANRPRTLLCHDMRGGYLQDRFSQGCEDDSAYRAIYWPYVDVFVYFSHHFVTIPPPCWTNAAHAHDVAILGTVITEWDEGRQNCAAFLASAESCRAFADQLILIAQTYGFDGWLINIECELTVTQVDMMLLFLSYLRVGLQMALSAPRGRGLVIWYDSVIHSGKLKWQDQLNDLNRKFFDCTDGIFLNYCWNEEKLKNSTIRAQSAGRPWDVYVGVDIFGRGCFGGGGFNTNMAMELVRKHQLSSALFAPGWVHEKMPDQFHTAEYRFWGLLVPFLYPKVHRSLPFVTNFCQGQGQHYFCQGQVLSTKAWTNLSLSSVLPLINDDGSMFADFTSAWQGGSSLRLQTFSESNDFRLFKFDYRIERTVVVLYMFRKQAEDTSFHLSVKVVTDARDERLYILGDKCLDKEDNVILAEEIHDKETSRQCFHFQAQNREWITRRFLLHDLKGCILKEVTAHLHSNRASSECPAIVNLGSLHICDEEHVQLYSVESLEVTSSLLVQQCELPNFVDVSCELTWFFDKPQNSSTDKDGHKAVMPSNHVCQENYTPEVTDDSIVFHVYYSYADKTTGEFCEPCLKGVNLGSVVRNFSTNVKVERALNKYRICGLLVDMNSTSIVRFFVQPVPNYGHCSNLDNCPFVDLEIATN